MLRFLLFVLLFIVTIIVIMRSAKNRREAWDMCLNKVKKNNHA